MYPEFESSLPATTPALTGLRAPAESAAAFAPSRPLRAWMLVGIAIAACAVYANSLYNGFAFDDMGIVKENIHVKDLMWNTIWTDNYWPTTEGIQPDALYRPLTLWSYLA